MHSFLKRLLAFLLLPATLTTLPAAVAPPNDDFANAVIVTGTDVVVSGSNVDATLEPGEPPVEGLSSHSVWWIWTPPVSGIVEVDTAGSTFDTVLAVYMGSRVSQLGQIAGDDDGGPDFTSRVRFSVNAGIPLALRVAGYGGAVGAIQLHVRADTGVKIVGHPADQLVATGGSTRFSVGATGPGPLSYQWLQDGIEILGATAPVLVLTNVTSAQAGRYQAVVRNGFTSVLSREARLTVTPSAPVVLFYHPQVVDTSNPAPDGEAVNLRSNLEALGHNVIPLANFESSPFLQPGLIVALPEAELGNPPASLGTLLSLFVHNGGTVVVSDGGGWLPLLNSAFSWNLFLASPFSHGLITDEVSGTPFEGGPDILPLNGASVVLANDSLPSGSRRIYDAGGTSLVAELPYGAGRVIWLGWDWYDGVPRGGQDGGWSGVLAAALEWGRRGADLDLAPVIISPPGPRALFPGETLELSVLAFGSQPLAYQWFRNSEPIGGAIDSMLRITNITTDLAGSYAVRVSNDRGSTNSPPVEVRVLELTGLDFRIQSLGSTGQVVDKNDITGDDRGGIAISSTRVFFTGDSGTGRFNADTLTEGAAIGALYDGLVSELAFERAYVLANANGPTAGGEVDRLIRLDDETGALTAEVVLLSRPVNLFGQNAGIYSGVGRCVLRSGFDGATWDVLIPSGAVRELPATQVPDLVWSENWAHWGLVESYDNQLHLVYVAQGNRVVRRTVGAAESTLIAQFDNLSDMASITASPRRGRWYFQYEGGAQFGGFFETLGYAEGQFVVGSQDSPPTILAPPVGGLFSAGGSGILSVTAFPSETSQFRWFRNGQLVPGATRPLLELTNLEATATGAYWVEVSNEFGRVTSDPVILRVLESNPGVTYLRSQAGRPWNSLENEIVLNLVFAPDSSAEGWNEAFFETADIPAVLARSRFLFADGSHVHAAAFRTFMSTHQTSLEHWVENGGSLFLNCAPFGTPAVELGFGGVRLVEVPGGIGGGEAVGEHPAFSGPFGSAGRSWVGASFAHAGLLGDQLTALIFGGGHLILAERAWGSGTVLFGTMTTPNYHTPYHAAISLRANLLAYGASRSTTAWLAPEFVYLKAEPPDLLRAYLSVDSSRRYRVESSPDLRTWTPFYEDVSAASGTLRVDLPTEGALARYLRAVKLAD